MSNLVALNALKGAAGATGSSGVFIDDIFSTYLYDGTGKSGGSTQTIVNGIDLAGKGGLVMSKNRDTTYHWGLTDTVRGVNKFLSTNDEDPQTTTTGDDQGITAFNNNGFTCGLDNAPGIINYDGSSNVRDSYVTYTFAKQEKFFDIITYTGTGSNQQISHNLGSVPGCIIIKRYSTGGTSEWNVYHRGIDLQSDASSGGPQNYRIRINVGNGRDSSVTSWQNFAPTDSIFKIGTHSDNNVDGASYVAYLFAHNETAFGVDGDASLIHCGSFFGNGSSTGPNVDLGWEPQWILLKNAEPSNNDEYWHIYDSMRGVDINGDDEYIRLGQNLAEQQQNRIRFLPTGFQLTNGNADINENGKRIIFIAIRRPDGYVGKERTGSELFHLDSTGAATHPAFASTQPVDMVMYRKHETHQNWYTGFRQLPGQEFTGPNHGNAISNFADMHFDHSLGWGKGGGWSSDYRSWAWTRGRGLDIVNYDGTGTHAGQSGQQWVKHNLGAVPEMIWCKTIESSENWSVGHKDLNSGNNPWHYRLVLNGTQAEGDDDWMFDDTAPTKTQFRVGEHNTTNKNGEKMIAMLFCSVDGVSKVGSYTGSNSDIDLNLGFAPRFLMIKPISITGDWHVFDTMRGIAAGDDPYMKFNLDQTQSGVDVIDPISNGIKILSNTAKGTNPNDGTTWSDNYSLSSGTFDYPVSRAHDGIQPSAGGWGDYAPYTRTSGNYITITLSLSVTVDSGHKVIVYTAYDSTCTVTVGGTTYTSSSGTKHEFANAGTLTQVTARGNSVNGRTYYQGVSVNGWLLVDGVSGGSNGGFDSTNKNGERYIYYAHA